MFATLTSRTFGLDRTWVAALPGLLLCGVLFAWFARERGSAHAPRERARLSELRPVARPLALLYLTVVTRSAVSTGFATFLPLYVHERGWSVEAGAAITTAYLAAGAMGGFAGGWLADRFGGRRVVRASFLLAAPFYVAFFTLPQQPGLVCLVIGYALLQASLPVNVVLGQELSPRHASTISSLLMGAAWGLGALLVGPIGALADHAGLRVALSTLSGLIALGFAFAMALPARPQPSVGEVSPAEQGAAP
jgi:FSR family fosmidomycin resistance protein-like MFS transporter